MQRILDATAGSRMIWFDKQNKDVLYMDNRQLTDVLCDGRTLNVNPDLIADFRDMPFEDNSFYLVVFDPPHLLRAGKFSWLAKKYGVLETTWREDIRQGFQECMRVLKPNGTLIFKWNEEQVKLSQVIKAIGQKPVCYKSEHKMNDTSPYKFIQNIINKQSNTKTKGGGCKWTSDTASAAYSFWR